MASIWTFLALAQTTVILACVPLARSIQKFSASLWHSQPILLLSCSAIIIFICLILSERYYRAFSRLYSANWGMLHSGLVLTLLFFVLLFIVSAAELMHIPLYAGLAAPLRMRFDGRRGLIYALIISMIVSLCDEGLQWLHPERYFDWRDLLLNLYGAGMGLFLAEPFARIRDRTNPASC